MFSAHPHFCALVMFWERLSQWFQEADSDGFSNRYEPVTPKHLNMCVYLNTRRQDKRPAHCLLLGRGVPRDHTRTLKHYQLSAWWGDSRNTPVCQRASRNSVNRLRIKEWKRWRVCVRGGWGEGDGAWGTAEPRHFDSCRGGVYGACQVVEGGERKVTHSSGRHNGAMWEAGKAACEGEIQIGWQALGR